MKEIYEEALFKLRMFEREHNMRYFGDVVPQPYSNRIEELINNYEKAIEILKENHEIVLHYGDEFPTPMISINGVYSYINKQEYELVKEVLENEK